MYTTNKTPNNNPCVNSPATTAWSRLSSKRCQ